MGKCQICDKINVDTISGVCGECIGKNRARTRQKRNIIKLVSILIICAVVISILGYLANSGILQTTMNNVSNQAIQTTQQLRQQIPNVTEPISSAIKSFNVTNTNFTPPPLRPKPVIEIYTLEQEIHSLIDIERQKNGIAPLSLDQKLSTIARNHSLDMANRNYFEHNTPEGQDPTARGTAFGYSCHKELGGWYSDGLAENIYQNNLYNSVEYMYGMPISHDWNDMETLANSTVQGWMNSSGHRHNILTSTFDREGIGVAIAADDKVYITEDFC